MVRRVLIAVVCTVVTCAGAAGAVAATDGGVGSVYGRASVNRAIARRTAVRLLAAIPTPTGATASHGVGDALRRPGFDEATPNLVDADRFYVTTLAPDAAIAQLAGRLPAWARRHPGATEGGTGVQGRDWDLPAVPGLVARVIAVSAVGVGGGRTLVRLDGEAIWLAPRAAAQRIPADVGSATVSGYGQMADGARLPDSAPVTVGATGARALAAALNTDELFQPGTRACPEATVEQITVRFAGPTGRPLAQAVESPTGCASVALRIAGGAHATLADGIPAGLTLQAALVHVGAIPTCAADELSGARTAASGHALSVTVRSRATTMCTLRGMPRVWLTDGAGRTLAARDRPATAREQTPSVILYPGTAAQFTTTMMSCARAPRARQVRFVLPGVPGTLQGPVTARLTPCPRGTLDVSALQSAS